jgi:hypothetical protein
MHQRNAKNTNFREGCHFIFCKSIPGHPTMAMEAKSLVVGSLRPGSSEKST